MKKLQGLLSAGALALRDGTWQPVDAATLVCGDIVRVGGGQYDKVPADIRITKTKDMKVRSTRSCKFAYVDLTPIGRQQLYHRRGRAPGAWHGVHA